MSINEFSYLWEESNKDDVLVKVSSGYSIFNKKDRTVLLIEDDDLENIVIENMLKCNKCVYDSIREAMKLL